MLHSPLFLTVDVLQRPQSEITMFSRNSLVTPFLNDILIDNFLCNWRYCILSPNYRGHTENIRIVYNNLISKINLPHGWAWRFQVYILLFYPFVDTCLFLLFCDSVDFPYLFIHFINLKYIEVIRRSTLFVRYFVK